MFSMPILVGGDVDSVNGKNPPSKRKHLYKTIEQNLNNINVSDTDRRCAVSLCIWKICFCFHTC